MSAVSPLAGTMVSIFRMLFFVLSLTTSTYVFAMSSAIEDAPSYSTSSYCTAPMMPIVGGQAGVQYRALNMSTSIPDTLATARERTVHISQSMLTELMASNALASPPCNGSAIFPAASDIITSHLSRDGAMRFGTPLFSASNQSFCIYSRRVDTMPLGSTWLGLPSLFAMTETGTSLLPIAEKGENAPWDTIGSFGTAHLHLFVQSSRALLTAPMRDSHLCATTSLCRPLDIFSPKSLLIMSFRYVVTKVCRLLPFDSAHISAAENNLPTPYGKCAAFAQDMVTCAKKEVRHKLSADAIIP